MEPTGHKDYNGFSNNGIEQRPVDLSAARQQLTFVEDLLTKCRADSTKLPGSFLHVRQVHGKYRFYLAEKSKKDGARRDRYLRQSEVPLIKELSQKKYARQMLPVLQAEYDSLSRFLSTYHPNHKYNQSDFIRKGTEDFVSPYIVELREVGLKWATANYQRNSYSIDPAQSFLSEKGDMVRSKSELLIANYLWKANLPYRYEMLLQLTRGMTVYPDFTVMHPFTGELYYIEYFGLMSDATYAAKTFEKINLYAQAGFANHLISFFEYPGVPFNVKAVSATLKQYFFS